MDRSEDFKAWLDVIGMNQHAKLLIENEISFDVLPEITENDLTDLGMPLGARKRLLKAIGERTAAQANATKTNSDATLSDAAARTSSERRQVTVLFFDLAGSTAR